MDVDGKVAVITGSSAGVGRGTAELLASLGAKVVINYAHSRDDAEETVQAITDAGDPRVAPHQAAERVAHVHQIEGGARRDRVVAPRQARGTRFRGVIQRRTGGPSRGCPKHQPLQQ